MCLWCEGDNIRCHELLVDYGKRVDDYPLLSQLTKANGDGQEQFDFGLSEEDASIAATQFAVYSHEITRAGLSEKFGQPLTPGQLAAAAGRVAAQKEVGLAKLSASARSALAPIYEQVETALLDMVEGRINPIQAAERMQAVLARAEAAPGGFDPELYQPYQWARLCRTEANFADNIEQRSSYEREYEADFSQLDELAAGQPPYHPNCLCGLDVVEVDGKFHAVIDLSPSACEVCQDLADSVTTAILGAS